MRERTDQWKAEIWMIVIAIILFAWLIFSIGCSCHSAKARINPQQLTGESLVIRNMSNHCVVSPGFIREYAKTHEDWAKFVWYMDCQGNFCCDLKILGEGK